MDRFGLIFTLAVTLFLPPAEGEEWIGPVHYEQRVENLSICLAMEREILSRIIDGTLRNGGRMSVACRIEAPKAQEH